MIRTLMSTFALGKMIFKPALFIIGALFAYSSIGTVWMWPVLWALAAFALFKWGPRGASEIGKTPWTLIGTKGNIFSAALVGLVAPIVGAMLWPLIIIMMCGAPLMAGGKPNHG